MTSFIASAFNFVSEHEIMNVQQNQKRMEMNWAQMILVYVDDVHLLDDSTRQHTKDLFQSNAVGLELNTASYLVARTEGEIVT